MQLSPGAFEDYEAVTSRAFNFLKTLAENNPALSDVCESFAYLDHLTKKSDSQEALALRSELLVLAEGFQKRALELTDEDNTEWLETSITTDIDSLFNSLPSDLLKKHNETLNLLTDAISKDFKNQETSVVEALKESITPESLVEAQLDLSPSLLEKLKNKAKLSPKQLLQVLAACAVLSLPSDEIQFDAGPEGHFQGFENLTPPTSQQVAEVIIPSTKNFLPSAPPEPLQQASTDRAFELWETVPYPPEVVQRESQSMAERLEFVLDHPERRALYDALRFHPGLDETVPLIGIIESNLNPDALSHSGAMGAFQDMGGTQGGFGDTYTLNRLLENAERLLPQVDYAPYNAAQARGGHHLKQFLIAQEDQNTAFWQEFLVAQRTILNNPDTAQFVSHFYLRSLHLQAASILETEDMNDPEIRYLAIGMYNVGGGNMRILKSIMQNYGINEFNTNTMLRFIESPDFETHMAAQGRTYMLQRYYEMSSYVARYIALEGLIRHNHSRISDSTLG